MAEKGLGLGLGALLGEEALENPQTDFEYVMLSRLEPRADQPRYVFDEVKLQELADSIAEHGVIQPLTVRALEDGYYQIIAGERRWRASRLAGLEKVPVRIIGADEQTAAELALVENLQREDLNPLEEARGYQTLMKEYGLTQEKTATVVGKSRPVIANALRLLSLPENLLALLEDGSLTPGAARTLVSLPTQEMQEQAANQIIKDGLSVRQAEDLVKSMLEKRPIRSAKKEADSIYLKEAMRNLEHSLGRKVKVTGGGNKGKITLEYYDSDDFNQLYELLCRLNKKTRKKENDSKF